MEEYSTKFFGETISIRADFSQASCPVERKGEDDWSNTGYQVADFNHVPWKAMERELEEIVEAGGDDPEDYRDKIDAAISAMK